ncbi:MAG: ATP-binding cassette domain-containing protein [Paracoccaceae bacterium]|nr:ATP-binding cassette domain-containing protein [Paracoccaceae bacterium]
MYQAVLHIEGLSLWARSKPVLEDVDFALPPVGLTALLGPVGTGKSTLLKWLCAKADPAIYTAEVRRAQYFYAPLTARNRPLLYAQQQGQSFEQMMQSFSVQLGSNPPLFCLDEPTANLTPSESQRVMERLAVIAQSRSVLLISHNQALIRPYADQVMLLAGGRLQEIAATEQFFQSPRTEAGRQFVGSGWVLAPGLGTPAHHLSPELRAERVEVGIETIGADGRLLSLCGGKAFVYNLPEDGTAPPSDADALREAGIDTLVVPETQESVVAGSLGQFGIELAGLDTAPASPGFAAVRARCQSVQARRDTGNRLAFVRLGDAPTATRAVTLQLVYMGVPACTAGEIAAELLGGPGLAPATEQELWDFELMLDVESDDIAAAPEPSLDAPLPDLPPASVRQPRKRTTRPALRTETL